MARLFYQILFVVLSCVYSSIWKVIAVVDSIKSLTGVIIPKLVHGNLTWRKVKTELEAQHKLPKHVACVFTDSTELDLRDVVRLLKWVGQVGVRCISLYDHDGFLISHKEVLRQHLEQQNLVKSSDFEYCLQSFAMEENHNSVKCSQYTEAVKVVLLSHRDGHKHFSRIARNFAFSTNISKDDVDCEVRKHYPAEPELLLQFGCASSNVLLGYPPWDLRLTEMLRLPGQNPTEEQVISCFRQYGRCEQRFGK